MELERAKRANSSYLQQGEPENNVNITSMSPNNNNLKKESMQNKKQLKLIKQKKEQFLQDFSNQNQTPINANFLKNIQQAVEMTEKKLGKKMNFKFDEEGGDAVFEKEEFAAQNKNNQGNDQNKNTSKEPKSSDIPRKKTRTRTKKTSKKVNGKNKNNISQLSMDKISENDEESIQNQSNANINNINSINNNYSNSFKQQNKKAYYSPSNHSTKSNKNSKSQQQQPNSKKQGELKLPQLNNNSGVNRSINGAAGTEGNNEKENQKGLNNGNSQQRQEQLQELPKILEGMNKNVDSCDYLLKKKMNNGINKNVQDKVVSEFKDMDCKVTFFKPQQNNSFTHQSNINSNSLNSKKPPIFNQNGKNSISNHSLANKIQKNQKFILEKANSNTNINNVQSQQQQQNNVPGSVQVLQDNLNQFRQHTSPMKNVRSPSVNSAVREKNNSSYQPSENNLNKMELKEKILFANSNNIHYMDNHSSASHSANHRNPSKGRNYSACPKMPAKEKNTISRSDIYKKHEELYRIRQEQNNSRNDGHMVNKVEDKDFERLNNLQSKNMNARQDLLDIQKQMLDINYKKELEKIKINIKGNYDQQQQKLAMH